MIIYCVSAAFIAFGYVWLIVYILGFWLQPKKKSTQNQNASLIDISIIIPVRNEERYIAACIRSILENLNFQDYNPEIVIIDDHSGDNTVNIVKSFESSNIRLLHLSDYLKGTSVNAYKKAALNYGLLNARGNYIIQLDGDVVLGKNYLNAIFECLKNESPDFIAAPVKFNYTGGPFSAFQCLDMVGMMGMTQSGIESRHWYLANGANMIFKKSLITHNLFGPASGDDVFGIQDLSRGGDKTILFLQSRDAVVITGHPPTLRAFYNQRIRWATKNKRMTSLKLQALMSITFLNALLIAITFVLAFFVNPFLFVLLAFQLLLKLSVDYIFLSQLVGFFDHQKAMKYFLPSAMLHILYISVMGVLSLVIRQYDWKARQVS